MPNIQLAKNLRYLRKTNHLTQEHLSTLLNVSRQAYSNYETSKRTPDLDALTHLCKIYDVTLDKLVHHNISNVLAESKSPYMPAMDISTKHTLQLTQEEVQLVMDYRCAPKNSQKMITSFLHAQNQ